MFYKLYLLNSYSYLIYLSQMCTLLQYFCDCELRHRVEAIVAYSDQFVHDIQSNQRVRYNLLMKAFTMSAAETARRTREFRSPPQDQVLILIFFREVQTDIEMGLYQKF